MNVPLALFLGGEFAAGCIAAAVVAWWQRAGRTMDAILAEDRQQRGGSRDG